MLALPFIANIPAKFHGPVRSRGGIDLVVLHTTEALAERPSGAESTARYFATMSDGRVASAHYVVDSNSIVRCVQDSVVAWAAPGANHNGLHVELSGTARQTAQQWSDPYSLDELNLAAKLVAAKCVEHHVPVVWLRSPQLLAGRRGITSHVEVSKAWKRSNHWDPGPNFPASWFTARCATLVAGDARQLWILVGQMDLKQNGMIVQPTGPSSGVQLAPVQVVDLLARGWFQVVHHAPVVVT